MLIVIITVLLRYPTAYYYRTDYLTKFIIMVINFGLNVYFGNVYNYWVCLSSAGPVRGGGGGVAGVVTPIHRWAE